jgi:predicted class III extradiol MEMO1 family dioxygenase
LDRAKITSINGSATEHAEEKESHAYVHGIEVQNPLMEARAL